ncbi:MAG: low specificity L-threonine aldolase [Spirochaetaceae bacterium]|nr:MAG: low specificity L-threonine aldolase [Spirochaetaceae bacterium]
MEPIDLRSDTVTKPTQEMRHAMYRAEVGDDVYGDDPTVNALEAYAAELVGKEAALFVPSGTFGNQLALFTHCQRGNEVVLSDQSHIVQHEVGAAAIIAGVQLRTFIPDGNYPVWDDIREHLRNGLDIHWPQTDLVALENALGNGEVLPLTIMEDIFKKAHVLDIPVHLDGARMFNAAHYLGIEADRIAGLADSVMFCLSKGLCAPIGSMLAGNGQFIEAARKKRKIMGGGMRQVGVIAACGLVALKTMRQRLSEDRDMAEAIASLFRNTGLFEVKPEPVKINMFFLRYRDCVSADREERLAEELVKAGVRVNPPEDGWIRIVTHHDVSTVDLSLIHRQIEMAVSAVGS